LVALEKIVMYTRSGKSNNVKGELSAIPRTWSEFQQVSEDPSNILAGPNSFTFRLETDDALIAM
jgi:hypothetical protein